MKYLFIATFILGIFSGVWLTGQSVSMNTLVKQNCSSDNTSKVVLLNNIEVSNPLGKITCGHQETLDKGVKALDESVGVIDKGLDGLSQSLDEETHGKNLDNIGINFDFSS